MNSVLCVVLIGRNANIMLSLIGERARHHQGVQIQAGAIYTCVCVLTYQKYDTARFLLLEREKTYSGLCSNRNTFTVVRKTGCSIETKAHATILVLTKKSAHITFSQTKMAVA